MHLLWQPPMSESPSALEPMWRLSPRGSYSCAAIRAMSWATAYNIVAIPVAAGLFVHWGFDLPMSVGAVAMSLSTIIVAANAQLLRGLKLQHDALRPAR